MRARCRFCKKVMTGSTFSAHIQTSVLNFLLKPAKLLFAKALEFYMMMHFRDGWDDHMAVYANKVFKIPCPECKKKLCWEPYPEKEPKQVTVKAKKKMESETTI